jgi:phosphopantothenoylcysteine decarboxylase/phosphopantothenate--cysteine ligase
LRFVGEASFAALSGAPVLTEEFERDPARGAFPGAEAPTHEPLSHLELVGNAEVYLIAPASANTIAKLAAGLADNLLTTCALAATCPVVVAPAMNNHMYEHPATQANLELLRGRGVHIVEPDSGRLASVGEYGIGRLADPAKLLEACEAALAKAPPGADPQTDPTDALSTREDMQGLRVLITAGGTREPIDSVRFIGNSSSGRMGYELANAALGRGAQVTLVAANVSLRAPTGATLLTVCTAAEMRQRCEGEFERCDVLLMSAAVADFRPSAPEQGKIKKGTRERLQLDLEPTVDVLLELAGRRRPGQTLVGFAAEHGQEAIDHGREKLALKGLDAIVVNDISRADIGFQSDHNEVTILIANSAGEIERRDVPRASKAHIAEAILDAVVGLRGPDGH